MRIPILFLTLGGLVGLAACDRDRDAKGRGGSTANGATAAAGVPVDPKEAELAALPVGIEVTHAPNPVRAQTGGRSGYAYTWTHATTVRGTTGGPLTVEEFGSFVWHDGRWVFANFTGRPFTAADFADWYACPDAVLRPGAAYTDPSNWGGGTQLRPGRAKWYVVARDGRGGRVKGEAVVDHAGELAAP